MILPIEFLVLVIVPFSVVYYGIICIKISEADYKSTKHLLLDLIPLYATIKVVAQTIQNMVKDLIAGYKEIQAKTAKQKEKV